jgi:excisionase family DNA binding protein
VESVRTTSPIMSLKEAADYLHVSKSHLSHVLSGRVPGVPPVRSFRLGRRILIRREWIDQWLEATARKAATEC